MLSKYLNNSRKKWKMFLMASTLKEYTKKLCVVRKEPTPKMHSERVYGKMLWPSLSHFFSFYYLKVTSDSKFLPCVHRHCGPNNLWGDKEDNPFIMTAWECNLPPQRKQRPQKQNKINLSPKYLHTSNFILIGLNTCP